MKFQSLKRIGNVSWIWNKSLRHPLKLPPSTAGITVNKQYYDHKSMRSTGTQPKCGPAELMQTKACYLARSKKRPILAIVKTWTWSKLKINKNPFHCGYRCKPNKNRLGKRIGTLKTVCNAWTHFLLKRLLKQLFVGKVFCSFIPPPAANEGRRIA